MDGEEMDAAGHGAMRYAVTVAVSPPPGRPPLDPLQTEGLAAMIGRVIDHAEEAIASDGSHVTLVDRWLGCHPEGALVALVLDAPGSAHAADAARALIEHVLQANDSLDDWSITEVSTRETVREPLHGHPTGVSTLDDCSSAAALFQRPVAHGTDHQRDG